MFSFKLIYKFNNRYYLSYVYRSIIWRRESRIRKLCNKKEG